MPKQTNKQTNNSSQPKNRTRIQLNVNKCVFKSATLVPKKNYSLNTKSFNTHTHTHTKWLKRGDRRLKRWIYDNIYWMIEGGKSLEVRERRRGERIIFEKYYRIDYRALFGYPELQNSLQKTKKNFFFFLKISASPMN